MTLQHKLQDSASTLGVPTTDVGAIIHTAQVRQKRRKAGVAVATVGLIVTAGVAVRELADVRSNNQELGVSQPIDAPTDSGSATAPPPGATATPQATRDDRGRLEIPNATPAVATDPQLQWVAVPADSPQALAARFDNAQRYAISTAPSDPTTGEPGPRQLFEYTEGAWSEVPFSVPEGLRAVVPSGDFVYAVSTSPAAAGGRPGTLGTYNPSTAEWEMTPLPEQALGYTSERVATTVDYTVAPVDGGVLVLAHTNGGHLKWDAFPELTARTGEWGTFDWVADGTVVSYENCDDAAITGERNEAERPAAVTTTTPGTIPGTTPGTVPGGADLTVADHCEKRVYQPGELGLTDADQRALADGSRLSLWRVANGEVTAVELPQPNARGGTLYNGILDLNIDEGAYTQYRIEPDGSFTPVFTDMPAQRCEYEGHASLGCFVGGAVATPTGAVSANEHYLFSNNAGSGSTVVTDLAPLFADIGANASAFVTGGGAIGDVFVGNASVQYDPPNVVPQDGSVSASGYSLRSADGYVDVIDDSTGQPVDMIDLSTESGKVEVWIGDSGAPSATTAPPATTVVDSSIPAGVVRTGKKVTFDVDWRTVSGLNSRRNGLLYTTIDGVHVSVVDPLQVAGLPADTRYSTGFVDVSGKHVTAEVSLADGTTMMLIGTPIQ